MSDNENQEIAKRLEATNLEVRRYTSNVLGQLSVGFTVTGVVAPGIQLVLNGDVKGYTLWVVIACWMIAFILYIAGEHQLLKGDE